MMSIKSRVAVAALFAMIWNTAAFSEEGRPVTAADISGKKICWNTGHTSMFAANGQVVFDSGHHANWSVSEPGVIVTGNTERQTVVLPDGRLQEHWFVGRSSKGADKYLWGTVCK